MIPRNKCATVLCGLALLVAVSACTNPRLEYSHGSPAELAAAVLAALVERDAASLRKLALSKEEFERIVWPSLPAARPERNLSVDYVWGDLNQKSEVSMISTIKAHGGERYALRKVILEHVRDYGAFRVHAQARLLVSLAGSERELRVCGSLVEREGRWKVFSFVVDD